MTAYRILVLGGYGHFGGRVCRALMHHATLIVAGRDGAKAEKFARGLGAAHQGVAMDCSASALAERVRALRADAARTTKGGPRDSIGIWWRGAATGRRSRAFLQSCSRVNRQRVRSQCVGRCRAWS